eukprot:gene56938-biopygen53529
MEEQLVESRDVAELPAALNELGGPDEAATTQRQLGEWMVAKLTKDFATADALRDALRARGVDPDTAQL